MRKTLLAFRHELYQNQVLEAHTKQLTTEQQKIKLQQDLQQIRKQGYGMSVSEIDEGVLGVSAPIFKGNDVLAVVSVMAPEFRSTHRVDEFITHTRQTAHNITKLINLSNYDTTFQWQGRTDGETQEHLRIHQVINKHTPAKFALIGLLLMRAFDAIKAAKVQKQALMQFVINWQVCLFINHLQSKMSVQFAVMMAI